MAYHRPPRDPRAQVSPGQAVAEIVIMAMLGILILAILWFAKPALAWATMLHP